MRKIFSIILLVLFLIPLNVNATVQGDFLVTGNVEGVVGFQLDNDTVTLDLTTLYDAGVEFDTTQIEAGDDISSWFNFDPEITGLKAIVFSADSDSIIVDFNGSYKTKVDNQQIIVTIPQAYLINYSDDLSNSPTDNALYIGTSDPTAVYHEAYTVSGEVGKEIETQTIIVDTNDANDNSLQGYEYTYDNGLTAKVIKVEEGDTLYKRIITLEFTGTPTKVDHSQIEYIIPGDKVYYIGDLAVTLREDVIFNIVDHAPTPVEEDPVIIPYEPVITGID